MVHVVKHSPKERGAIAVIVAVCSLLLMGITSIVIDLGNARALDLHAQAAGDAGALAAAQDLPTTGSDSAASSTARLTAATFAASAYGLTPTSTSCEGGPSTDTSCYAVGANITLSITSPYNGNSQNLHISVCEDSPTFFAGAIGLAAPTVCSQGVAGVSVPIEAAPSVLALSPNKCPGLELHSGADVVAVGGAIQVNSSCTGSALTQEGSGATLTSDSCVCVVGGAAMDDADNATPTVQTGANVVTDPYASVPIVPEPVNAGFTAGVTVHAGTYDNLLVLSGNNTYIFTPGIFYFKNGLKVEGKASIHGHNVMIYLAGGMLNIGGDKHEIHLTPLNPASDPTGQYQDIVLYQAPGNTTQAEYGDKTQAGDATSTGCDVSQKDGGFEGGIYFPSATLKLRGTVTMCATGPVVADHINLEGTALLHVDSSAYVNNSVGDPVFGLVD